MNDSDISRLMKQSPDEGCRALFDEYWSYAYTIVFQILRSRGSPRDIEECTSDVLSDVMLSFDTEREGSLKAYIGTAAKRRAIDMSRSLAAGRTVSAESGDIGELPSGEDVQSGAEDSELTRLLIEKIKALGEPDSTIIIQRYFFDRNSGEISRIVGLNPITVRSRLRRSLKRLRSQLEGLDIDI